MPGMEERREDSKGCNLAWQQDEEKVFMHCKDTRKWKPCRNGWVTIQWKKHRRAKGYVEQDKESA